MASNTGCTSVGELADDAQDLGGRGLVLERFLGLVEQPRVLDRDHGLVGEGLAAARSSLSSKRSQLAATDQDRADALPSQQHRRDRDRVAAESRPRSAQSSGTLGVVEDVGVGDDAALANRLLGGGAGRAARGKMPAGSLDAARRQAPRIATAVRQLLGRRRRATTDAAGRRRTAARSDQDLLEHRLRVGHRAADHAQHFGRRGLLLERLLRLVEQAHVLDRDHRLVGEGLQQGDLLVAGTARPRRARRRWRRSPGRRAASARRAGCGSRRLLRAVARSRTPGRR